MENEAGDFVMFLIGAIIGSAMIIWKLWGLFIEWWVGDILYWKYTYRVTKREQHFFRYDSKIEYAVQWKRRRFRRLFIKRWEDVEIDHSPQVYSTYLDADAVRQDLMKANKTEETILVNHESK